MPFCSFFATVEDPTEKDNAVVAYSQAKTKLIILFAKYQKSTTTNTHTYQTKSEQYKGFILSYLYFLQDFNPQKCSLKEIQLRTKHLTQLSHFLPCLIALQDFQSGSPSAKKTAPHDFLDATKSFKSTYNNELEAVNKYLNDGGTLRLLSCVGLVLLIIIKYNPHLLAALTPILATIITLAILALFIAPIAIRFIQEYMVKEEIYIKSHLTKADSLGYHYIAALEEQSSKPPEVENEANNIAENNQMPQPANGL